MLLEVCAGSIHDCIAAVDGGADRLELNAALSTSGLTPSIGTIQEVTSSTDVPVIVMIRPREGNFQYSRQEISVMEHDIHAVLDAGADGVAFGVLSDDGSIDTAVCRRLIAAAQGREAVFHRAFDCTPDPLQALETCIDLGFTRVLTSGQEPCAVDGAPLIRHLVKRAGRKIEVLPGGCITADSVKELVRDTGCSQVHGTFSAHVSANTSSVLDFSYKAVDVEKVRAVRNRLDELSYPAG